MPDNTHLHHILLGFNIRHKTTVFIIQFYSLFFVSIAFVYVGMSKFFAFLLFCMAFFLLALVKPILKLFFKSGLVKYFIEAKRLPVYLILLYKKNVISAIIFICIILLIASFPGKSIFLFNEIALPVLFLLILFFISFYRNIKKGEYKETYIFICWSIFFFITRPETHFLGNIWINDSIMDIVHIASFIILTLLIMIFFISNNQLYEKKTNILNGFDLIIIVIILLSFLLNSFIAKKFPSYIGINFLQAFLFSMSYKIVVQIKPSLLKSLFYLSFIIPIIALLVIIFIT